MNIVFHFIYTLKSYDNIINCLFLRSLYCLNGIKVSMALRLLQMYGELVKRRPFATQALTAGLYCKKYFDVFYIFDQTRSRLLIFCFLGLLTTFGDIIAQCTERRLSRYSFRRTVVMSTCGFLYFV